MQEEFLSWTRWPPLYQDKLRMVTIWNELTPDEAGDLKVLLLVRGLDLSPFKDDERDESYRETLMTNLDRFEQKLDDKNHKLLLHLAQEFVHENHRELETNLWIVKPVGVYIATLILGNATSAMSTVFNEVLKSIRERIPFNNPLKRCPDERRWYICATIAADWAALTKAIASRRAPNTFDQDRVHFFTPFPVVRPDNLDASVQHHLVQKMSMVFRDPTVTVKLSHMYFALMELLYQKHADYEYIFVNGTPSETVEFDHYSDEE